MPRIKILPTACKRKRRKIKSFVRKLCWCEYLKSDRANGLADDRLKTMRIGLELAGSSAKAKTSLKRMSSSQSLIA